MKKSKGYHNVETVPKSNRKQNSRDKVKINTHNTQIHDRSLSWIGTGKMMRSTSKMMRVTGEMMRGTAKMTSGTGEMMRGTGEMMRGTVKMVQNAYTLK